MDPLPEDQKRRLVVAIDYGITHTGIRLASARPDLESPLINTIRGRVGHTYWV